MKFSIITFGCKVNQYESNMMKESMLHHNFSYVENYIDADIIIINTCTVTDTADKKSLKAVKRHLKDNNKIIVVTGCSSQNNEALYKDLDIAILLGNKEKSIIGSLVQNYLITHERYFNISKTITKEFEDMFISDYNHVRAFIKIEDGCDNYCSYCIIPFVRGMVRSKDFDIVLKEAKELVKNNHKEIVLTGIHTGRYYSKDKDLSDLILELAKIKELERIRISSIEITELNEKFMNVLRTCDKLCNHLHIPLQSGCDKVLKLMNRKYDLDYFEKRLELIRSIRPNISITTDIIVGFPNETDEDFLTTLNTAKRFNFSKIHVFPYSKREGTKAARMIEQIDNRLKKKRVQDLIKLSDELEKEYYNSFKNKELDVLVETVKNGKSRGHTSNYLDVSIDKELQVGDLYNIKL